MGESDQGESNPSPSPAENPAPSPAPAPADGSPGNADPAPAQQAAPVINRFEVQPAQVEAGGAVQLTWSIGGSFSSVQIEGMSGTVSGADGQAQTTIQETTTFTLVVDGVRSNPKTVSVTAAQPAPADSPAPTDQTTAAPSNQTTAAPSDQTTAAPSDQTTAAPSDQTTAAPSDQTTAAPSDQTTAAPSDQTTAAPSDQTTAAPSDPTSAGTSNGDTAPRVTGQVDISPDDGTQQHDQSVQVAVSAACTLSWSATNAASVKISGLGDALSISGSQSIPTQEASYTLVAIATDGTASSPFVISVYTHPDDEVVSGHIDLSSGVAAVISLTALKDGSAVTHATVGDQITLVVVVSEATDSVTINGSTVAVAETADGHKQGTLDVAITEGMSGELNCEVSAAGAAGNSESLHLDIAPAEVPPSTTTAGETAMQAVLSGSNEGEAAGPTDAAAPPTTTTERFYLGNVTITATVTAGMDPLPTPAGDILVTSGATVSFSAECADGDSMNLELSPNGTSASIAPAGDGKLTGKLDVTVDKDVAFTATVMKGGDVFAKGHASARLQPASTTTAPPEFEAKNPGGVQIIALGPEMSEAKQAAGGSIQVPLGSNVRFQASFPLPKGADEGDCQIRLVVTGSKSALAQPIYGRGFGTAPGGSGLFSASGYTYYAATAAIEAVADADLTATVTGLLKGEEYATAQASVLTHPANALISDGNADDAQKITIGVGGRRVGPLTRQEWWSYYDGQMKPFVDRAMNVDYKNLKSSCAYKQRYLAEHPIGTAFVVRVFSRASASDPAKVAELVWGWVDAANSAFYGARNDPDKAAAALNEIVDSINAGGVALGLYSQRLEDGANNAITAIKFTAEAITAAATGGTSLTVTGGALVGAETAFMKIVEEKTAKGESLLKWKTSDVVQIAVGALCGAIEPVGKVAEKGATKGVGALTKQIYGEEASEIQEKMVEKAVAKVVKTSTDKLEKLGEECATKEEHEEKAKEFIRAEVKKEVSK